MIDVYMGEELYMIDEGIEKIVDNNKVMEILHEEIHWLKDKAQEKILEVERHYSDAWLEIVKYDEL